MNDRPPRAKPTNNLPPQLPHGYTLRDFTIADYEAAIALWETCEGIGLNESDSRTAISEFLVRNRGLSAVVCDRSNRIAGAILCGHDGRRGYLHHLAVASRHRRQGLGRVLVERCLMRLEALGIAKCNIFLYHDNKAGREFWLKNGWNGRDDLVLLQRLTRR